MPKLKDLGEMQSISVTFTKEQHTALVALARREERSIAYLVRLAVDKLLGLDKAIAGPLVGEQDRVA
jgi:hypothetical protein